ncbi:unnamed protein product [Lathyrus oleraceus]|uniref:Receptor-like serine/threonine-protein kinase n=1 Tax=Pisum sativum TaxID=3888 RepID=A0A9D4XKE9_PEA|nr:G-type lectin S-receptor-like serine/threonine-protein kinase SD2-2 [Pisum sativum]KAI5421812.1 hypothetical protein KIW84_045303 [Pisum sativum]
MSLLSLFFLLLFPLFTSSTSPNNNNNNSNVIILTGNQTLLSPNKTFQLGFFNLEQSQLNQPRYYLLIRFTSLPFPNITWLANRNKPSPSLSGSSLQLTRTGQLLIIHNDTVLWQTNTNTITEQQTLQPKLLENGNLILTTHNGVVSWQSFDEPTDTWLPGMNLTRVHSLLSWRTLTNPADGFYSLRLNPPYYGQFELVYNGTVSYWATGDWNGKKFSNVPEMDIPYLYRFDFEDAYSPTASFGFSERASDGVSPPTMFRVEANGLVRQYTWSSQAGAWNMFWSRPESICSVARVCGSFGVCTGDTSRSCECVKGFVAVDGGGWGGGDYSQGCWRGESGCDHSEGFEDLGAVKFGFDNVTTFRAKSRSLCKRHCLDSYDCVGLSFDQESGFCKNFVGSLFDFHNLTSLGGGDGNVLYVKVSGGKIKRLSARFLSGVVIGCVLFLVLILGVVTVTLVVLAKRKRLKKEREMGLEEDGFVQMLNLKVFSYKELQLATRGFSEKVGHGGFGTVFQGELSDSTVVAVKRLERPGGGEKEFRAEVSTIGNIQHINLVRLRGFCSENAHRLLVYEYMPNGALSAYLRKEGPCLSWDVRFRVAIGTAKGIAYLHEECRSCIIHCDIKPENILLDSDFTAKVSDFGLAKLIGRDFSRVLATMRGTWGYVAPEWISGVEITTKADVYSFGMTLLELLGGRRNVEAPPSSGDRKSACETGEKWFFPPWAAQLIINDNVAAVVDKKLENVYNIEEAKRVAMVAVWCIQDDEAVRPSMGMVVKMLEGLVDVALPPPPKLLQALVTGESFHGVKAYSSTAVSTAGSSFGDDNMEVSAADSESCIGDVFSPLDGIVNVR